MSLLELKAYLIKHHQVTLMDLAHHFQSTPENVQAMLSHWIVKGKVHHTQLGCNKGCCQSGPGLNIYRWVGDDSARSTVTSVSGNDTDQSR
jgi:hypothetical protein